MLDIEESQQICDGATPRPWQYLIHDYDWAEIDPTGFEIHHGFGWGCDDPECDCMEMAAQYDKDGRFVVHARDALPEALKELRAARRAIAELLCEMPQIRHDCPPKTAEVLDAALAEYEETVK